MRIKSTLGLAVAALLLAACQSNSYQVKGTTQGSADGVTVYLSTDFATGAPKDSATVQDGKFSFQGEADSTYLAVIYLAGMPEASATLFIEPGQNVSIELNAAERNASRVSGSKVNDEWQAMNDQLSELNKQSMQLLDSIDSPTPEQQKGLMEAMNKLEEKAVQVIASTAERNIGNELGFFILTNYMDMESFGIAKFNELLEKLPSAMAKRPAVKELQKQIAKAQETEVGSTIKEITLNTPDGQPLSLMSEVKKNQLTLIDFWASWCGPCRNDMPEVVALYKEYKDKGFGIVGISLDSDVEAWTNAIKELGITWPQMSDLKSWENEAAQLYGVRAIPQTFLVDKDGKILAKGLRGTALNEFVAKQLAE